MEEFEFTAEKRMPVLPIRGISVFPGTMLTFDVERPMSKAALHVAMNDDQIIFLTAQKDASVESPKEQDLYQVGTVCRIKQLLRTPGTKTVRVLVDGLARGRVRRMTKRTACYFADVEPIEDAAEENPILAEALLRRCAGQGLAEEDAGGWHLTPKGFLVSNEIIAQLQNELAREKNRRLEAAARGDYRMV